MTINGYRAVIAFDPVIQMFRGAFVGLNGGADFYAEDVEGLKREGGISLCVFLDACARRGAEPRKHFSGKFSLRVDPETHEAAVIAAAAHGQSLIDPPRCCFACRSGFSPTSRPEGRPTLKPFAGRINNQWATEAIRQAAAAK